MSGEVARHADDLDDAVRLSVTALRAVEQADWDRVLDGHAWSANEAADHIVDDFLGYATQVAGARSGGYLPFAIRVEDAAPPADRVALIAAAGAVLSAVIRVAPPATRAFHPCGVSDPGGFAALGAAEVLLHTYDIRLGLDRPWEIPAGLSRMVLERLAPDVTLDAGGDATCRLLWATGRADDARLGRRTAWRWDSRVRAVDAPRDE